jgi:hypothetical protein
MSRRRSIPLAVLAALCGLPALATAQQGHGTPPAAEPAPRAAPATITTGKDGFVLPEGAVGVEELIDAAALFLARNILWQGQELGNQPPFVFQKRLALDAIGCEEMLAQLLATRNLAVVPIDERRQVYEVLNLQGQRGREIVQRAVPRTPEEVLQRPNLKQIVLVTLPLQHINATIAVNALRPFFASNSPMPGQGLNIGTAGSNEAVLVLGFTDQVAACIRMLQQCDRPLQERNPELHQLGQTCQSLQHAVTDLQSRLATVQAQIAELQRATAPK